MFRSRPGRLLLAMMASGCVSVPAAAQTLLLNDSESFTVTEVGPTDAARIPDTFDRVTVGLKDGAASFIPKGKPLQTLEPRTIVIQLKDAGIAPLSNTSGYPDAFPRPGVKQILANDRVTIWDYTWTRGVPTPVHFHTKRVVVTYLAEGVLRSTAIDGTIGDTKTTFGLVTFNPTGRTHTETLISGAARAVIVELN